MKKLLILIFILSACSKGPSSRSHFQLVLSNLANNLDVSGGAYVETFELTSKKINLLKLDSSNTTEILHGIYDLVLVAFSGPSEAEGTIICGFASNVRLDRDESVINVTLNSENCSSAIYSRAILSIKKGKSSFWNKDYWNQSYWGI